MTRRMAIDFEEWCRLVHRLDFLESWDIEQNDGIKPSDISKGSNKKFHWKCSTCGTRYLRAPHYFSSKGQNGCPICWIAHRGASRHQTAVLKHNFLLNYPELAQEWIKEKNGNVAPYEVSYNDNKPYWWKCSSCGEEWKATIFNRIKGTGCPKCRTIFHSSFPERAIYYYVKKYYPDAISSDRSFGFELDIFIPSLRVGIEYDGQQWHQDRKKDEEKNRKCRENRIVLYRIRESECWFWKEDAYLRLIPTSTQNDLELNNAIAVLLMDINPYIIAPDVDVQRDRKEILGTYLVARQNNSLSMKYPELAKEFDTVKNAPLTPDKIDYGSGIMCSWICSKCGYSFEATPNARTCKKSGCPSCAHQVAWKGHTDIFTTNPELAKEWDFEKNRELGLNPDELLAGSEKKAFWRCEKGHSWMTSIVNRKKGRGCPICAREKNYKSVKNINTGAVFSSIKEAAAFYGINASKISEVCSGKRDSCGGFRWSYYNEDKE